MVVVVVVVVTGMVVLAVVVRARVAVYMAVAFRMIVAMTRMVVRAVVMRARRAVPMRVAVIAVIMVVAMRALAGRGHRAGNGRRLRVARIGAAHIGAAGMTVSWVVGTLGIGHDNLLNGFQWLDGVELTP
nr:hypothetical protein [Burkholderia cepacia]